MKQRRWFFFLSKRQLRQGSTPRVMDGTEPRQPAGTYGCCWFGYFEGTRLGRGMAWAMRAIRWRGAGFAAWGWTEPPAGFIRRFPGTPAAIDHSRATVGRSSPGAANGWGSGGECSRGKTVGVDATTLEAERPGDCAGIRCDATTGGELSGVLEPVGGRRRGIAIQRSEGPGVRWTGGQGGKEENLETKDWKHPWDPDGRFRKMKKDGRTHLAQPKPEHGGGLGEPARLVAHPAGRRQGRLPRRYSKTAIAAGGGKSKTRKRSTAPPEDAGAEISRHGAITAIRRWIDLGGAVGCGGSYRWRRPDRGPANCRKENSGPDPGCIANRRGFVEEARGRRPDASTGRADRTLIRAPSLRPQVGWRRTHMSGHTNNPSAAGLFMRGGLQFSGSSGAT